MLAAWQAPPRVPCCGVIEDRHLQAQESAVGGGALPSALEPTERARYARHLLLPEVGPEGQARLKASSVLVIGAGGLGSPLLTYLAAAGVGRLGIVDPDRVELSNLQRQILFSEATVGEYKADAARRRLQQVNPLVEVVAHRRRFHGGNALDLARGWQVIVDGTDNFATRYLSNDVAVWLGVPNVYASIHRFEGQCSVFAPHLGGPCYRCLFPRPPDPGAVPSCAEAGVLGALPGLLGTLQAVETIKLLLGLGDVLIGRLLHVDTLRMRFTTIRLKRDPDCAVCGPRPRIVEPIDYDQFCGGGAAPATEPGDLALEVEARELAQWLRSDRPPLLIDVREPGEAAIASIAGARLIPLGQLEQRLDELPAERTAALVLHCKSGVRSGRALELLRRHGWRQVRHLRGGIDAWREQVDSALADY